MIKPKRKFVKLDIKIQFICYNRGKVLANVTRTLTPHTYTTTTKKSIPLPKTFTFHGQQQQQQKKSQFPSQNIYISWSTPSTKPTMGPWLSLESGWSVRSPDESRSNRLVIVLVAFSPRRAWMSDAQVLLMLIPLLSIACQIGKKMLRMLLLNMVKTRMNYQYYSKMYLLSQFKSCVYPLRTIYSCCSEAIKESTSWSQCKSWIIKK